MSQKAEAATGGHGLEVQADRGYFSGEEIVACEAIGVTPCVSKPLTSRGKADDRFGNQDLTYVADQDAYLRTAAVPSGCPGSSPPAASGIISSGSIEGRPIGL